MKEIEADKNIAGLGPIKEDIIPVYHSKVEDVLQAVQALKVLSEKGTIHLMKDNNSLLVKDSVKRIASLRKLIKDKIDKPALQVLIEGKIIEAAENFSQNFGLQILSTDGAVPSTPGAGAGAGTTGANTPAGDLVLPFGNELGVGKINFRISNIPAISIGDLSARLDFMEQNDYAKVLASPRIVTLNNRAATIKQATRVATVVTEHREGGGSTERVEYRELPLSLDVTPIISAEGVMMKVVIKREFQGSNRNELTREANTEVFVKHGDTTVIGGVYTSDEDSVEVGVPFLRRLPLIGNLFKNFRKALSKNELLIFLTPTIVNRDLALNIGMNSESTNEEEFEAEFEEDDDI